MVEINSSFDCKINQKEVKVTVLYVDAYADAYDDCSFNVAVKMKMHVNNVTITFGDTVEGNGLTFQRGTGEDEDDLSLADVTELSCDALYEALCAVLGVTSEQIFELMGDSVFSDRSDCVLTALPGWDEMTMKIQEIVSPFYEKAIEEA